MPFIVLGTSHHNEDDQLLQPWGNKRWLASIEPYVSGRSGSWTNAKCRLGQHAVEGGWSVSDKGSSGLLLGIWKGKKLVPIGRVGTGYPNKLLRWLESRLK
jgi:ATP-dependent DNA ligase